MAKKKVTSNQGKHYEFGTLMTQIMQILLRYKNILDQAWLGYEL